jgi:NTE family protein
MAIDYYDSQIFEGKNFADFNLQNAPFIEINATDLAAGNRFSFIQAAFDLICSDLDKFSVARAVTASSAVPVAFPTVVLKNYAGECDSHRSNIVKQLNARSDNDPRTRRLMERVNSYLDRKSRPYIHLVDGGIVDNLGLRALADRIKTQGSGFFLRSGKRIPKDVLVIIVNAQVKPERSMDISANKPSVTDTINAMSDAQMSLYNDETKLLLQNKLDELKDEVNAQGLDVKFHTAEVSFDSVEAKTMKSFLNSLPTSLELSDQDVDILIDTAAQLLRRSPGYRKFLELNGGNRLKGTAGSTTTATAH